MPHYQPPWATFHVVFRLAGSLPVSVVRALQLGLKEQKKKVAAITRSSIRRESLQSIYEAHFREFERQLDIDVLGPRWLAESSIAEIVEEAIRFRDGKEYDLIASTIMPNHVHLVFEPVGRRVSSTYRVTDILENLKWYTALHCNRELGRTGPFWQHESYDHVIRDGDELEATIWYLLMNPVQARLTGQWEDWPWTYVKPGLL
jgi:putative transposase